MRKFLLFLSMVWLLTPTIQALTAVESTDGVITLPRNDGGFTYTVDGNVILVTDASLSYSYKDNGVIFTPKNAGEVIVATFENINLPSGAAILVYDNNVDAVKEKIGKSGASTGTYKYFPDGWCKAIVPGDQCEVFQSKDDTGSLIIGMHTTSWTTGTNGYKVKIESVVPKDMEYVSTSYEGNAALTRGAVNASLGSFTVTTEGLTKPLDVNAFSFDVTALENAGVKNIHLVYEDNTVALAHNGTVSTSTFLTLSSGKNVFTLYGDLPADFTGELALPSSVNLTVANTDRQVTFGGASIVGNVILMPAVHTVYTISDATKFYDDGGESGKISEKFNGAVTFVPSSVDQKIRIDFDKLALFYNSSAVSVGNQDVFKFYNGRSADEANLIRQITDEPAIVKSTAEDGSMTVTLVSKTGVPADGWEAVVSQFIPGDMTISNVSASGSSVTSTSAYDKDVHLATVRVDAINTLSPLSVTAINLNISGATDISEINVYALGEKNAFSTSKKVGTVANPTDGSLKLNISDGELSEGANYFGIAANISQLASNEDAIKLTVESVLTGDDSYILADGSITEVKIANAFSHHEGTDVREIHDTWQFTSTADPVSSSKYLLKDADCVVTFVPQAGASTILEFSDFDVYYSSGSYGARAVFEVYSGRTANAENLLWKLDSYQGQPQGKLKSSAEDGSMTIVFNAKTTSSYYAGKGWKATVTPFINHEMTIESIEVSQPNTSAIMAGAAGEQLLAMDIVTEGTLDSRRLKGLNVDLKDCRAYVTGLHLTGTDAEGASVVLGNATVGEETEVTIPCDITLAEGLNSFIVTVDVASGIAPDVTIDAKIVKIATDRGETAIENGDPDGERVVKYQYIMSAGDHTVTVSQAIHFYDDGGESGILNKDGISGNVIFQPAEPGKKIRITVLSYKTAATGIVNFYSGCTAEGTSIGQCKQSTFPELPLVSTAEDGSMLVNVECKSYSYGTYDGWDMYIEQYTPCDLYVKEATAATEAKAETVRGATDALMSKITLNYEGDKTALGVSALKAKVGATNMTDVTEAKLWYTAGSDGFAPTDLVATAVPDGEGNVSFEVGAPRTAEVLGKYYYWITLSMSAEATAGNTVSVNVSEVTMNNGTNIQVSNLNEGSTTLKAGFSGGEFVIGSSADADYSTFKAAIDALGDAIEGPVKFLVEPGTYTEDISINAIQGTSATNTITITSQSGNAADVTVTGKGYVDGGYGAAKYGVINITNTDWVTIDHLTVIGKKSGSTEYPYYVNYVEASRHNTLSNCVFSAETATSYSGLNMVYATCSDPVENGKNPDYLTITGNSFTGGYIAIYIQGSYGYVKYDHMKGLTVTNNNFTDVGSKCVYPYQIEDVVIANNVMTAGTAVTKTSYYAIDGVRLRGNIDIYNNRIVNNQTVYSSGIYLRDGSQGTTERQARIYNNAIAITASPNASTSGIVVTSDCMNMDLAHNSVNIEGAGGHGIYVANNYTTLANLRLVNNVVRVNVTGTGEAFAFRLATTSLADRIKFENNAFHSSSAISNLGVTATDWTQATGDATLINEEAKFLTASDLHLSEAGSLVAGSKVDYVTVDHEGTARSEVPTIGAYEFAKLSLDKPEIAPEYPRVESVTHNSAVVISQWTIGGKLHYLALETAEGAPTAESLLEAACVEATANTDARLSLSKLSQQTEYTVYMLLEGVNGVNSDIVTIQLTTPRYIAPLYVELESEWDDADKGDNVEVIPAIDGGDTPYTYVWTNRMGEVVGEDEILAVTAEKPEIYTLTVTSADGQKASAFTSVKVYGGQTAADFNDNLLEENSHWSGSPDEDLMQYHFFSGDFAFSNTSMPAYNFWGGFAYANYEHTTYSQLNPDQFYNVVGGGHTGSGYAVAYTMGAKCNIEVLKNRDGAELDHVYVTNTAYLKNHVTVGDGFAGPFATGDYHLVTFKGDDPQGSPVEVYLADYRNGGAQLLNEWKKVDLRPLGKNVKNITVSTSSSSYYAPAYVALDNLEYANNSSGVDEISGEFAGEIVKIRVITTDGAVVAAFANVQDYMTYTNSRSASAGIYLIEFTYANGSRQVKKQSLK